MKEAALGICLGGLVFAGTIGVLLHWEPEWLARWMYVDDAPEQSTAPETARADLRAVATQ